MGCLCLLIEVDKTGSESTPTSASAEEEGSSVIGKGSRAMLLLLFDDSKRVPR